MSEFLDKITPLILTYNEAANIGRTLSRLGWAKRIVVIDSGSTDETIAIANRVPSVELIQRRFDTHADQWNYGLDQVRSEWVLGLDADYELSKEVVAELRALRDHFRVAGYRARFIYRIEGRSLRGSLYPPRTVLHRVAGARYFNRGHTQDLEIAGPIGDLAAWIYHDDRKPLSRWLDSQRRYAALEAEYLARADRRTLTRGGRIRRLGWAAPILVFFYVLVVRRCALDGRAGWFYALQRLLAETLIALEVLNRRLNPAVKVGGDAAVGKAPPIPATAGGVDREPVTLPGRSAGPLSAEPGNR